jgi:phospholipid/cholesterol/gamma-HCH transport system substrate-binding protein
VATPRQKVQVGIFLSVCGVLLVGTLVVLSGLRRETMVPYFIEFDESVSGLASGAEVRYRGVPVGRVTDIAVTPSNRIRVRVEIRPSVLYVRPGMTAQLGTAGVTGQLYINLAGGNFDEAALPAGATIPAVPSLLTNLTTELPTMLASINSILLRIDKALGEEGQVAAIAQSAEKLFVGLNQTVVEVNARTLSLLERFDALTDKELRDLLSELTATVQTTRQVMTRTETAIQEALSSSTKALQRLERDVAAFDPQGTSANLKRTLQSIATLTEKFGRSTEELNLTLQGIRSDATNVEFHIRQAGRIWRDALVSAKELFDYLEQDPSALVLGKRAPAPSRDGRQNR